tara:strand:+ start:949 stop:2184 length:1236 start_codon:yes stop_codon:yes gene_type:complete
MNDTNLFPAEEIKKDFPIFKNKIYGKNLIFLDTAASAQKPQCVIDSINNCYSNDYSNIHRGIYYLSSKLTTDYEDVREKISKFINAQSPCEIVFTKSATEALNLLANCLVKKFLKDEDEIVISYLEHHANIVPWQIQKLDKNIKLVVADLNIDSTLNIDDLFKKITKKTKVISITHMSNALGHINDIKKITTEAKKRNILTIVDGCQYIAHGKVDVQDLGCDFYVFSGHKIYGPSGVGVLFGKKDLLDQFPPYQGGGDMIDEVTMEKTTFAEIPQRFEAGTPPIVQVIGLGEAINYISKIGLEEIQIYEKHLYQYAYEKIINIPNLKIIGHSNNKGGIISFTINSIHPSDIGTILDQDGIAIRTGHHCNQPLMKKLGISATARLSFGVYNTLQDIDILIDSLKKINKFFEK